MAGPTRRLDGIAFAGMFVFGIVMALLGVVLPILSRRLSLHLGDVGTVFLVTNAMMLAASLVVGPTIDRFGIKAPLSSGALLVAVALSGIAVASKFSELLWAAALLGLGGGALNATTNTLVADLHDNPDEKAAALNLLGVFFGFGALFLPFSVGALLQSTSLAALLYAAAALCVVTAAVALTLRFPAPKQAQGWPLANVGGFLRLPLVLALALLLFFQSGNEFILGGYFATFVSRDLGASVTEASYLLAAYWAAVMISRVLLSRGVLRIGSHRIVLAGAMLAAVGALAVAAAQTAAVAAGAIVITGFALAGIFPTVLGIAGAAFREHSGTVFGILFTVALTGGMTLPWIAGQLAESWGLRAVFLLSAVNFLTLAALNAVAARAERHLRRS